MKTVHLKVLHFRTMKYKVEVKFSLFVCVNCISHLTDINQYSSLALSFRPVSLLYGSSHIALICVIVALHDGGCNNLHGLRT